MGDDPQEIAESLDEDVVEGADDTTGDAYGEGLPGYPPDRPLGVETFGVTATEEDAGESFTERVAHEDPDEPVADEDRDVGQIVEPHASSRDDEEELVADESPGIGTRGAEDAAMHLDEGD